MNRTPSLYEITSCPPFLSRGVVVTRDSACLPGRVGDRAQSVTGPMAASALAQAFFDFGADPSLLALGLSLILVAFSWLVLGIHLIFLQRRLFRITKIRRARFLLHSSARRPSVC